LKYEGEIEFQVHDIKKWVSKTLYRVNETEFRVSKTKKWVSDIKKRVSEIEFRSHEIKIRVNIQIKSIDKGQEGE